MKIRDLERKILDYYDICAVDKSGNYHKADSEYKYLYDEVEELCSSIEFDCFPTLKNHLDKIFVNKILIHTKDVLITTNLSSDKALNFKGEIYGLILPRDFKITEDTSNDEILELELKRYQVERLENLPENAEVIITRHKATSDLLKSLYPNAEILETNATDETVADKIIAGVLPPNLISKCESFVKFTVKDFDYTKDSDMSLLELQQRGYELAHIQVREVINY